jgi:hypothetical protein
MDGPNDRDLGALSPFWNFVQQVADMHAESAGAAATDLVALTIETPIELEITADDDGDVTIASAPPTQQIETTFMPVFHHMRVTVTPKNASNAN